MSRRLKLAALTAALLLPGAALADVAPEPPVSAPVAAKRDFEVKAPHGAARNDPYYWLREKENPEVIAYLEAENSFADAFFAPLKPAVDAVYEELRARFDDADVEVPYAKNGDYYQSRFEEGADYPVIVRRKGGKDGPEEIILNVPELAKAHDQYNLNGWEVSPDGQRVAFAVDFSGNRVHEIFVRDLVTGTVTSTGIKDASNDLVWTADGLSLLYAKVDETVRSHQIKRITLGADPASATVVMDEPDNTLSLSVGAAKSKKFAIITVYHLQRTELRVLSLEDPNAELKILLPRSKNARGFADHLDGHFYILTNDGAPDLRIVSAPDSDPSEANWQTVIPETKGRYISGFALLQDYIAIEEIHDAVQTVRVVGRKDGTQIALPEFGALGVTGLERNEDPALTSLRVEFVGPLAPPTLFEVDLKTAQKTELKRDPAWSWFKPELYETARIQAKTADGSLVPVTVMWRKDKRVDGALNPALIYGYGSYGSSSLPAFYQSWFTLMDRGFVFAVAHVRGGRELGQAWYEAGRMQNKMNTFTDFIAASEALVSQGYADPKRLFARGGSAGGLLMGAIMNMRPDLYAGIVAEVPFVDVLTTMLDETIPLTTFEWEEWGDPRKAADYAWMAAYSPYDNVKAQNYPALFVATGLNDSQVGYFEPAKWVAKLRATKTGDSPLLFKINMGAGHGGDSGRLGFLEERAYVIAFLLNQAGLAAQ